MVERFLGNWRMTASDNFVEYMKALGIGFATRQVANKVKPNLLVSVDAGGTVTMRSRSTFKTVEIKFRLGEEFDETTADGRRARTLVTLESGGRKLVQRQTWDGKTTTLEREIEDGKLIVKCVMDNVVAVRTYERIVEA